ncbi:hypothetical protein [Rubrivivax gelatinosus]|uniref:hypothetical protein n=1 Tax=Rubrivivax gelatinosus TaxID=28068 RepID=UPI0005C1E288|nr:hypothetical protein [Rubrivivax gelatinosus]MBG6083146.1 hypothetical protein [Rubrivivax gelatinosus]
MQPQSYPARPSALERALAKATRADKSIAAYDAELLTRFQVLTRERNDRLNALAAAIVDDCDLVTRDRALNKVTRDHYRGHAKFFRSQIIEWGEVLVARRPNRGATCE